jgi:hypothetical protein
VAFEGVVAAKYPAHLAAKMAAAWQYLAAMGKKMAAAARQSQEKHLAIGWRRMQSA